MLRVTCALAIALVLTACGSEDPQPAAPGDVQATAVESLRDAFANATSDLAESEINCLVDGFVQRVGLSELQSHDLIDSTGHLGAGEFDARLAGQFADSYLDCVDYPRKQADLIKSIDPSVAVKPLRNCLNRQLPRKFVRRLIVASQLGIPAASTLQEESQARIRQCQLRAQR